MCRRVYMWVSNNKEKGKNLSKGYIVSESDITPYQNLTLDIQTYTHTIPIYSVASLCVYTYMCMIFEILITRHGIHCKTIDIWAFYFEQTTTESYNLLNFIPNILHIHIYSHKITEPYQRQHLATNLTNDIRFEHSGFAVAAAASASAGYHTHYTNTSK